MVIGIKTILLGKIINAHGIAAIDLFPAGDAGFYFMAAGLFFVVKREVFYQKGTRTDEAHITFEHIDKLGYFV